MKINLDEYAVNIQCVRAVDLRRGAVLLLNTHAAAKLGIISAPLSKRGGAASDLPEITCLVEAGVRLDFFHLQIKSPSGLWPDLQRLRDSTPLTAYLKPFAHTRPIVWPRPCSDG